MKRLKDVITKDAKSYWKMLKANKRNNEIPVQLNEFYEHIKLLANDDSNHEYENIV